jgi:prepilin-type processing-associated H-X9-DG protein
MKRFETAFTLVEMLVIIAVIGVLAALLLPTLGRAKESARATACLSNLRQVGTALQLYVQDHDNRLPVMYDALISTNGPSTNTATIDIVLTNYLGSRNILRCRSDNKDLFEQTGSSYAWNSLLNGQDADHLQVFGMQFDPHNIPVVFDKEAFHRARGPERGVNYLYADGRIQNLLVLEGTK